MIPEELFYIDLNLPVIIMIVWALVMLIQVILSILFNKPKQKFNRQELIWLASLTALMVLTSIFAGYDISTGKFEIAPLWSSSASSPAMLLSALSWMWAALFLNPLLAFSLAIASGFLNAVFFTHSILTPLYYGLAALCFSRLLNLDISIKPGKVINTPLVKSIMTIAMQIPIAFLLNLITSVSKNFRFLVANNLIIEQQQINLYLVILISGIVVQISLLVFKKKWLVLSKNAKKITSSGRNFLFVWLIFSCAIILNLFTWQEFADSFVEEKYFLLLLVINLVILILAVLIWKISIQKQLLEWKLILQTNQMINGNFNEIYQKDPLRKKSSQLEKSVDELRKVIKVDREVQQRLIALDPALPEMKSIGDVLSHILRSVYDQTVSSVRIILFNKENVAAASDTPVRLGLGTHNKIFAYMDDLIATRLLKDEALFLSNLKVNQIMDLKPGMPFPPALIALRLEKEGNHIGNLWIGFIENRWYDAADRIFYNNIAIRAANMISNAQDARHANSLYEQFSGILDEIPHPIVLANANGEIQFTNSAGKAIDCQILTKYVKNEVDELNNAMIGSIEKNSTSQKKTLQTNDHRYSNIYFDKSIIGGLPDNYLLVLKDESLIESSMDKNSEFVATVSHALRMPLTRIKGYTSLLENIGSLSDQQIIYMQRIFSELDTMQKLIDNILNMERLEANVPLQYSQIQVGSLVKSVIDSLSHQAVKKKINLAVNLNGLDQQKIFVDEILLQQALINLLDNTIRFSALEDTVDIQVNKVDKLIQFMIKDTGPGIAPLDIPRLFDKYFHVESGQTIAGRGVGLGLAIVRSVAEKHRGQVRVTSQLGQGSTFYLEIPIDLS